MNLYYVRMIDESNKKTGFYVEIPDLVENVTEWLAEEFPEFFGIDLVRYIPPTIARPVKTSGKMIKESA